MQGGFSQGSERGRGPAQAVAALDACHEPLLAIVRGGAIESIHRGAIAVVDVGGSLLGGAGDPHMEILLRSAAKPFQAAAIVQSGAAQAFSLTDEEIAVISASHAGAPEHVETVQALLARAGLSAGALVCGSVEHMCSGKHAGMMLLALHLGVAVGGYERDQHPVQREIGGYVASLLGTCPRRLRPGISGALFAGRDGCGVPVIRTTLYEAAWLYASLAAGVTPVLARVRDAMIAHPVLVAGEARLDTRLMRAASGRLMAKGGAEGVQGIGVLPTAAAGGLGCIMKVEDGSARPIPPVVGLLLRTWGLAEAAAAVERDYPVALVDSAGVAVGSMESLVKPPSPQARDTAAEAGGRHRSLPVNPPPDRWRLFGARDDRVTVCRGDEKDILRFLSAQWPAVDEGQFGRTLEWSAVPYALVFRRDKKIAAVLKGHFIGGVASVDELMVAEGVRGAGLGSLLLGRFEDEARRRACSRIILRAVKNTRAEDFYRARGYHRECVQHGYEFGYDYVRLTCDVEKALGEDGSEREGKGAR